MRILICDEDKEFVDMLKQKIEFILKNETYSLDICLSYLNMESMIHERNYDLILMNGIMNQKDCFLFVKYIQYKNKDCQIIIISQYKECILQSFQYHIFQFLFKEMDENLFQEEIMRFLHIYKQKKAKCIIYTKEGVKTFFPSEIYYIETRNRKLYMMTTMGLFEGDIHNLSKVKKQLLEFDFYQIHQSFFLNLNTILSIKKGEVTLLNSEIIPTSILNREAIKEKINEFLKV